jgi:peptidoglycan/xylan/chitin deacetylase (PgdA/CDA1 family)
MKIFFRRLGFLLSFSLILAACAGQKAAVVTETAQPEYSHPVNTLSPEFFARFEEVLGIVERNSGELKKYFILDGESNIIVKADVILQSGEEKEDVIFEVLYDLDRALPLGDALFKINFSVEEKETGSRRHGELFWTPAEDSSGVLLAFDDDYQEVWARNFDLFDRYGGKVTFFIQGKPDPFCAEALSRGHDIGWHTSNHLNLLKVTKDVFFEETIAGAELFRAEGIPLGAFAYPFGLWEPWMHEFLKESFTVLRGYGVTYRLYNAEAIRGSYISSKAIDNILYKNDEDFDRIMAHMLRTVKFIGGILPLTTHNISDTADWGIKPRRLEYVLKTIRTLGLKFYRYCDF